MDHKNFECLNHTNRGRIFKKLPDLRGLAYVDDDNRIGRISQTLRFILELNDTRYCLCLVTSMTSGLVDVVSGCLELSETLKISSTDVHTSFLKEYSLVDFVRNVVRRDLTHNLSD